jgi:hypothetical protein
MIASRRTETTAGDFARERAGGTDPYNIALSPGETRRQVWRNNGSPTANSTPDPRTHRKMGLTATNKRYLWNS